MDWLSLNQTHYLEWFKYCTRASKQNDDNIVKAYERMKKSLEREYKELGTYLSHYDFSKCMPIPRIKTDEKMVENYYKGFTHRTKNCYNKFNK